MLGYIVFSLVVCYQAASSVALMCSHPTSAADDTALLQKEVRIHTDGAMSPLDLFQIFTKYRYETWGPACCDVCGPSCAPTKRLMDDIIMQAQGALTNAQAEAKLNTLVQEWHPFLEKMKSKYTSVADAFAQSEKAAYGEASKRWLQAQLNLSEDAFTLADSDKSGGLSFAELQDYGHLCLEFVGAVGLAPGGSFDGWSWGDFMCLNGPPRTSPASCEATKRT
eukprot:gnl/TRDRNA2_/TRDRNA2_39170_c0_seq1.p1 gnl/TRDRNA2_/TRDRNA2_39170_c0~~gnl/TRDRNA2_/TRDRNA2_39170_c0_seq1.p1  ORF type:complete len:223 (-),score=32.17 gnl/TRDRNA2_/TRDRNA2_39170_c0_seq1:134-802(-)